MSPRRQVREQLFLKQITVGVCSLQCLNGWDCHSLRGQAWSSVSKVLALISTRNSSVCIFMLCRYYADAYIHTRMHSLGSNFWPLEFRRTLLLWASKTLSATKLWSIKTCGSPPCALAVDPSPAGLEIPVEKLTPKKTFCSCPCLTPPLNSLSQRTFRFSWGCLSWAGLFNMIPQLSSLGPVVGGSEVFTYLHGQVKQYLQQRAQTLCSLALSSYIPC